MVKEEKEEEKTRLLPWLQTLLERKFFVQCSSHGSESTKTECNMFCIDCKSDPLCNSCIPLHQDHRLIQIRRSSYHDVIRASEIIRFMDIGGVQTYIINSARVVFLKDRPQQRHSKPVANACVVCDRGLLDNFSFCSLSCKAKGTKIMNNEKNASISTMQRTHLLENFHPLAKQPVTMKSTRRRKGIPRRASFGI